MPIPIEMPKLSDTMTEGVLLKWHKQVGDFIEIGDVLAEIETDKATMEMEAFDEGVLAEILVEAGAKIPIGEKLALLTEEGETIEKGKSQIKKETKKRKKSSKKEIASPKKQKKLNSSPALSPKTQGGRIKASPLAKKIANEKNLDLSQISGTGPGGRIIGRDLEQAPQSAKTPISSPALSQKGKTKKDLSSIRRIIAERLLESKTSIPHFYLHLKAEVSNLLTFRQEINQGVENGGNKYTVNDLVVKAMVRAVKKVPAINASFGGNKIIQFDEIGVAVAIAIEEGLVTPVIRNAQEKSLLEISQAVKDMAMRSKQGKLRPDEFDGGTITISNLGSFGIESFDAIINPPQACILSIGTTIETPIVKNGEIVIGKQMDLGISCDHRVVDGAIAAQFLTALKETLENPSLILL